TVDFRNVVIIMTSNIGSTFILEHTGDAWDVVETQVTATMRQHFKPEFLNRVDDIIVFRPLGREQIDHIVADVRGAELVFERGGAPAEAVSA
ncbi:MAG TPA: AAA family ATPase, partial [Gemmatimonadaceae bacterium]|nr:AAA family ATPase [Gemmatimonadaceae bacterium]